MDRFRVGFYGSLIWLGATVVALAFTAVLLSGVFSVAFGAGAQAARSGREIRMEEVFEPMIQQIRPWLGVIQISSAITLLGEGLTLVGLQALRKRLGKPPLATLAVGLGLAGLIAGTGLFVQGLFVPFEESYRASLRGGFGAGDFAAIALAIPSLLYLILVGVLFLVRRPDIPGPSLATGILFVLSLLGFLLPVALALLAVTFRKLEKSPPPATPAS